MLSYYQPMSLDSTIMGQKYVNWDGRVVGRHRPHQYIFIYHHDNNKINLLNTVVVRWSNLIKQRNCILCLINRLII